MSTSKVDATVAGIIALMKKRGLTLATAESITGGALAGRITDTKGASAIFLGSIVSYSDASKTKFLGVAKRVLTKSTAVSEVVARQMAEAARREFGADFAIATTGVAGPGRAYGQKAGTVWIAIASKKETITVELALTGDRDSIRKATIESALACLSRILTP
jgi:nicotinamide-nucleotide amidase